MVRLQKFLSILVAVVLLLVVVPLAFAQEDTGNNKDVVAVTLSDFNINISDSIPSGNVNFEITNDGDSEHGFTIEGNGIEEGLKANLQPGETQQVEVNLEPGDYRIYSPVGDDATQGMDLQVTAVEAAAGETATDVTAEDTTVNQPENTTAEPAAGQAETAAESETTAQGETSANAPAALPQTGAVSFPWTETVLVGGGLALIAIGLGLVLGFRRHS